MSGSQAISARSMTQGGCSLNAPQARSAGRAVGAIGG